MKKYLERLSLALDKVNANNKSTIIEKYRKRYEFGLESGLSEQEIEEMLGDPETIAEKYRTETNNFENKRYDKEHNCVIKTVNDNITIKKWVTDSNQNFPQFESPLKYVQMYTPEEYHTYFGSNYLLYFRNF